MFYIDFQALHFHTGFQQPARLDGILLIFVGGPETYLIFVIFFTRAKFLDTKIYTEKRQFFALNL